MCACAYNTENTRTLDIAVPRAVHITQVTVRFSRWQHCYALKHLHPSAIRVYCAKRAYLALDPANVRLETRLKRDIRACIAERCGPLDELGSGGVS
jgi:hypothetical protein